MVNKLFSKQVVLTASNLIKPVFFFFFLFFYLFFFFLGGWKWLQRKSCFDFMAGHQSLSAETNPGSMHGLMTSLCVCTGGEVSCCHQRRWTVLALSIFPSSRAIITSVPPSSSHLSCCNLS